MKNIDQAWEDFARREPFFAVVPTESHRHANLTPETEAAFFAEGAARVDWVVPRPGHHRAGF